MKRESCDKRPGPSIGCGALPETRGINLYSEYDLHMSLKEWACSGGGRVEVLIGGKVADGIDGDGNIVEVQIGKFGTLRAKIPAWTSAGLKVRVIRPIGSTTTLVLSDPEGETVLSCRKSPKHGTFWDIFSDLVHYPELLANESVALEVLLTEQKERRIALKEARRSGRFLKKNRTVGRELEAILEVKAFKGKADWLRLLPQGLGSGILSSTLAEAAGIPDALARKMLYCYTRAGFLRVGGKEGKRIVYERD